MVANTLVADDDRPQERSNGSRQPWTAPLTPTSSMPGVPAHFVDATGKPVSLADVAAWMNGGAEETARLRAALDRAMAPAAPILFQRGAFRLHSGAVSAWKIECDSLGSEDWQGLATMAIEVLPPFGSVEGVPRGGIPLAAALRDFVTSGPPLIVDDVLTTGSSMEKQRSGRDAIGLVAFARGACPAWVTPLFVAATVRG